ncbi:Uncharacterised protein [uncultured archaeon]|nr:Uncharacterised protein [uncultured archaeon]
MKAQSSIEQLMTYSWSILVVMLALAALFWLGVVNPSALVTPYCSFTTDVQCASYSINTTGNFTLDLKQDTDHDITVTHVRCTQEKEVLLNDSDLLSEPVAIPMGSHAELATGGKSCMAYSPGGTSVATGSTGNAFKGYFYVEYHETETGFEHVTVGEVLMKFN